MSTELEVQLIMSLLTFGTFFFIALGYFSTKKTNDSLIETNRILVSKTRAEYLPRFKENDHSVLVYPDKFGNPARFSFVNVGNVAQQDFHLLM